MSNPELVADADVLDKVATVAEFLAGEASAAGETDHAAAVAGEAVILRNWAALCRTVGA